jgi:hypothetical protein
MNDKINIALLQLIRRAEAADRNMLLETFVDAGALVTLLSSPDHQVIHGRRGTGKTHALIYLAETKVAQGDVAVYIDMRTIGSTGGLYADTSISLGERATRLLADTLSAIHEGLLRNAVDADSGINLGVVGPLLDQFIEAAVQVVVVGQVQTETAREVEAAREATQSGEFKLTNSGASATLGGVSKESGKQAERSKVATSGTARHRVHFGAIGDTLKKIMEAIAPKRLWLLLDEWSVVPLDLQPYLADFLRRSAFPAQHVTVKLAAIEQRTHLKLPGTQGDYIGIELGADAAADVNLDDFMVFDNDANRATTFFSALLFKHYLAVVEAAEKIEQVGSANQIEKSSETKGPSASPKTAEEFVQTAFTQRNAFEELVRAAEGVPRDAINILALCAQKATSNPISIGHIRAAAKTWYVRDKEAAVSANAEARNLLHWINDEVIAHRRARAFLLKSGISHPLIDALFDARVLHFLKRNISAHDQPGVRYDAYKIDYGCYVDLLTTANEPAGLLPADENTADGKQQYVAVPPDDYRAIRRAILDLTAFEERH